MVRIVQWLAGPRPFQEGVELLKAHGAPDSGLATLLDVGETGYGRQRLEEALEALLEQKVIDTKEAIREITRNREPIDRVLHPYRDLLRIEDYPPQLQEVRKLVWPLKEEQEFLRGGVETDPDQVSRRTKFIRIMAIERERFRHFKRLDHWRMFGVDLGAEPPLQTQHLDRNQLERRQRTLWTYRSRYKDQPDKWAPYASELANIEQQLRALHDG